ncbi:MAG TPA: hypothetical protein DD622_02965 [Opitutae bacterium]|nr:hypothetical protein [Opitutae bacterium]|tara:strand:- start:302 stop:1063 length:762 start_codon:yes stop_codon:yes gene_type:complete
MINRLVSQIVITTAICFLPLHAENKLQDTRDVLDQWVETKQIISEERADWRLEQSILKDSQSLLDNELARLTQALADLEASATAADEDRTQLAAEKDLLKAASSVVEANIGGLETKMKALVTSLPQPLVDKIKPLMRRLPDDPNNTKLSLGERVQNIVGILSQADKFNTTITLSNESREIADGKIVQVTTLYWGLAMAYFVDKSGEYAGIGTPDASGWAWQELPEAGSQIKQLLDIYEGTQEIKFVSVPARLN